MADYYRWDNSKKPPKGTPYLDLLWPVEVWAVQVPAPSSGINVLQEAVLGLMRAGVKDLLEMALLLALDKDLAAFIIAQELQPRGWLDQRLNITEKGKNALAGEADSDMPPQAMYAFRDSLTGQWLPRLSEGLPSIHPVPGSRSQKPKFELNLDSGKTLEPFVLHHRRWPAPNLAALRQSVRDFQRAVRQADHQDADVWGDLDEEGIELLDSVPQIAYVWCQVYAPSQDVQPWLISDPWGLRRALKQLRESLERALPQEPALEVRMQQRLSLGAAPSGQLDRDLEAQIELNAEARVRQLLGALNTTPQHQEVRDRVLRVLRLESQIKDTAHPRQELLASLSTESGAMLEALMQWLLVRWPIHTHTNSWPREWPRSQTEAWLADLPLSTVLTHEQVKLLGGQSSRTIRRAANQQGQAFKALLVAALLATPHHSDHPLRQSGLTGLDFDQLQLRNQGSHASGTRLQRDDVLALAEMCLSWLGQFRSSFSA